MNDLEPFLAATEVIDWHEPTIRTLADTLSQHTQGESALTKRTFEFVRDNIQHCIDYGRDEVTCRASDVLRVGTGYCYAKSHLLAALLRANGIPTGFCYQRLSLDGDGAPFSLHGLNSVFLNGHSWYRVDARGNKHGVCAEFSPPREQLAFTTDAPGEFDFPGVLPEPLPLVIAALSDETSAADLVGRLPDLPPISFSDESS